MTERLPGKFPQDLHTQPWFSSGKVPEIKYSYTQSGLTPSSYPIRARSIIPGPRREDEQKSFQSTESGESFQREFKEYNFLRENEVLLTIEHCDNCENHSSSTRHDPIKYFNLAQSLKNMILARYPMVKILTKPLSKLDPAVNQRRLGAFEVQIAKKSKGLLSVHQIHSKLTTRRWPDISDLVIKVAKFLPTCQLFVTVFDENSQEKNLKGLKVRVRPKALDHEMQRPESSHSNIRPKSAVSVKSFKSIRSTSTRRIQGKETSKLAQQQVFEKVTDRDGMCLFEGIPLDIYEIEVLETKEFKGAIKVFNTFEEKVQNLSLNVYIGISSRENSNLVVLLKDFLVKSEVSGAKVSVIKEAEEFFMAEVRRGVYEISVPKGDYLLQVKMSKYKDVCRRIVAKNTEVVLTENLELKSTREVAISTFDAINGEVISGVHIELVVNNQQTFEGLTKSGRFSFKLDETGLFYFKSQVSGYFKSKIYSVVTSETTYVCIPLVPISYTSPIFIISWTRLSDDIEVQGQIGSKSLNFINPQTAGYTLIDKLKSHGYSTILLPEQGNDLRLCVAGLSTDLMRKNGFIQAGVSVQFYSFLKIRASLRPPLGAGQWWDCGVYSVDKKDFLETNILSDHKILDYQFYDDVLAVQKYLFTVDNIQNAFGFAHGINKMGNTGLDLILSPEIFKKISGTLVSEDFLNIFSESLSVAEGISMNLLQSRYGKFIGLGLSPYKKIDFFIKELGLSKEDLDNYRKVVEEFFHLKFPKDWDVVYDENGEMWYVGENGQKTNEHPSVFLCKQRINQAKSNENKSKNTSFRPRTPNQRKKGSDINSESSSGSGKVEKKNGNSHNKETKKYMSEVNKHCETLYNLSSQSVEFYTKKNIFDKKNHMKLIDKIEEFIENCESQLKSEENQPLYDLFYSWWEKFVAILQKMKEIEENLKKPLKKAKKNDSSSSSSSSSNLT